MTLLSQCGNRAKACSLSTAEDAVDDLALNQATEKRNVLRRLQQIHKPAACAQKFYRGLPGGHRRIVIWRLRHLNFFPAEKLPDDRHSEFERQRQARHFFTCFDHTT